jgi:hypothetical protein
VGDAVILHRAEHVILLGSAYGSTGVYSATLGKALTPNSPISTVDYIVRGRYIQNRYTGAPPIWVVLPIADSAASTVIVLCGGFHGTTGTTHVLGWRDTTGSSRFAVSLVNATPAPAFVGGVVFGSLDYASVIPTPVGRSVVALAGALGNSADRPFIVGCDGRSAQLGAHVGYSHRLNEVALFQEVGRNDLRIYGAIVVPSYLGRGTLARITKDPGKLLLEMQGLYQKRGTVVAADAGPLLRVGLG